MASIARKSTSPFWIACFTDHAGRQRQRSTKETDRKRALAMALQFEETARGRPNERQIRKVLGDVYREAHQQELPQETIRSYLSRWRERKAVELRASTFARYKTAIEKFVVWLGERADRDLGLLVAGDFLAFRTHVSLKLCARSANIDLKILRIAFGDAEKERLLPGNPAKEVTFLRVTPSEGAERRPFSSEEIRRLLATADEEWKGLILAGYYSGQRLGDVARLRWRQVNFELGELTFSTSKTSRLVQTPIGMPLLEYLKSRAENVTPDQPVFPAANDLVTKSKGQVRRLSNQFYEILVAAGLAAKRKKASTGAGHGVKRKVNELSFHSLRHTLTSDLKNAGVSEVIAMDWVGHDSRAISRVYTHISSSAKRDALKQLPNVV